VIKEAPPKEDWPQKGRWDEVFGNDNPIRIEIGMGKGAFITAQAERNPEINFVGIEKFSSVLLRAVQKQEILKLPNLIFIRMDAEYICDVFEKEEVDKVYLNFSDPWPKARHAKRRLTSKSFLARYEKILREGGRVEFKTDNDELFAFSLEELKQTSWTLIAATEDIYNSPLCEGNIMTEYERKFSSLGKKISKYIIEKS
jgi:tRNA (guanine-N7-)-methyltransferase